MRALIISVVFGLTWSGLANAQCSHGSAFWTAEHNSVRHVLYGDNGINYGSNITIEEWRQSTLAWTTKGQVTCSNGASICYAQITNARENSTSGAAPTTTDAIIETIDENGDGTAEWVVLAALSQLLRWEGANATWHLERDPGEVARPPNVYRFQGCRSTQEPTQELSRQVIVGQLYATRDVCQTFLKTGVPVHANSDEFDDGLWWMDDEKVVGWEHHCLIASAYDETLHLACVGEGEARTETWSYLEEENRRLVNGKELLLCQ